jgi:anaerobic selenocysteine-containing dehydrogenase
MEVKKVLCASCDISCSVAAEVDDGKLLRIRASDNPFFKDNICMKGIAAPKGFANPNRILKPLKRVGERGSGDWEEVSWDAAMSDIGQRLRKIIDDHGPEAWATSTSQWNTSTDYGMGRRLMNLTGSPNWISGVALCAGNTAAINRMTYGWFPFPDFGNTECIVLFGHNPKRHSWTPIYNNIRNAQRRGAKLIVLDPRRSENAEQADLWLPLKAGTDTAMCMGWLKVILDEGLYDEAFVAQWTHGFEEFRARVDEFPLERVAEITGVDAELIAKAARMYATNGPSIIPWTPITDQQRNSTSAIRLHCALRALCGYVDVPGGEVLGGFNPDIVPESEIEMHEALSQAQRDKQLGSDTHPAFTYRGTAALAEPTKRVWGREYANLVTGSYMANPSAVFRAMAYGEPYPVKAFFFLGNNPLMSYANMPLIHEALMNQDLIVGHEQFMTPTAQLADYILPADAWTERSWIADSWSWTSVARPSQQAVEAPGECKSTFEFWRLLGHELGHDEHIPWSSLKDIHDYRLKGTGHDFESFSEAFEVYPGALEFKKYEKTGFATPTGKVELKSTILEELGFDALPYYREDPPVDPAYPLSMFTGVREDEYFQTGHRHIEELRKRRPEPQTFLAPETAAEWNVAHGEWVEVENKTGRIKIQVAVREDMPPGLVRIPHGWWKPEMEQGLGKLSGAWDHADAQLCPDDEDYLDREQGIPHLKGIPCRINKLGADEALGG